MTIAFRIKLHHQSDKFSSFVSLMNKNAAVFVVDTKRLKVWLHSGVHKSRTPNRETKLCTMGPNICGYSVWELASCHPSDV